MYKIFAITVSLFCMPFASAMHMALKMKKDYPVSSTAYLSDQKSLDIAKAYIDRGEVTDFKKLCNNPIYLAKIDAEMGSSVATWYKYFYLPCIEYTIQSNKEELFQFLIKENPFRLNNYHGYIRIYFGRNGDSPIGTVVQDIASIDQKKYVAYCLANNCKYFRKTVLKGENDCDVYKKEEIIDEKQWENKKTQLLSNQPQQSSDQEEYREINDIVKQIIAHIENNDSDKAIQLLDDHRIDFLKHCDLTKLGDLSWGLMDTSILYTQKKFFEYCVQKNPFMTHNCIAFRMINETPLDLMNYQIKITRDDKLKQQYLSFLEIAKKGGLKCYLSKQIDIIDDQVLKLDEYFNEIEWTQWIKTRLMIK